MSRVVGWLALASGVGLAAAGAVVAYFLGGGPWTAAGAAMGAVAGAFAPSLYDGIRESGKRHRDLQGSFEPPLPQSWARLLDPRLELVSFVGREGELAELVAWCEDERAGRLRLVTGPGGVGKTRLAVELGERMKKARWRSERIADGQEGTAIATLRAATSARALLVVDYAETRVWLRQMLTALASEQGEGVRLLLIARSTGDWWDQLGAGEPAVWDLVQDAKQWELALSPVIDADLADADVIAAAVTSFARELGLAERAVEIYGDTGGGQRRVLDLHAAALVAVLHEAVPGLVRVDLRTVLGELLRHEQHFWYESARSFGLSDGQGGITALAQRQIIAAGCLLGAATQEEARLLPARVPGVSPSVKIADWLRVLYPPDRGETDWIGSLQPDRLAELHTLRELAAAPELGRALLTDLNARQALRAVTLLARASSDYPEAETLLSRTLPDVAGLVADMQAPAETLAAIFNAIPYPTVILAPAAASLSQRITEHLPASTEPAVRAYWLANLGVRLSELGRPADELPVTEEAVRLYRTLAAESPNRYNPQLVTSLANLGAVLSDLGRLAEALPIKEETVAMCRELAAANPNQYLPELARALGNQGATFLDLGRAADAVPVTEEAIATYRKLAVR